MKNLIVALGLVTLVAACKKGEEVSKVKQETHGIKSEGQRSLGQESPQKPQEAISANALKELNNLNDIINNMLNNALDENGEKRNNSLYDKLKSVCIKQLRLHW